MYAALAASGRSGASLDSPGSAIKHSGKALTPAYSGYSVASPSSTSYEPSPSVHEGSAEQQILPVRTSCNFCRGKKVKCDKASPDDGGCARCKREGIECCYDVRDPIGRPRKRKASSSEKGQSSPSWAGVGFDAPANTGPSTLKRIVPQSSCCSAGRSTATGPSSSLGHGTSTAARQEPLSSDSYPNEAIFQAHPSQYSNESTEHPSSMPHFMSPPLSTPSVNAVPSSSMPTPTSMSSVDTFRFAHTNDGSSSLPPNLSDLGLAAFLESLDTLEIAPEDGLTPNMLSSIGGASNSLGGMEASFAGAGPIPSLQDAASSSALSFASMGASTSYAVPADLSWADPAWLFRMPQFQKPQTATAANGTARGITSSNGESQARQKNGLDGAWQPKTFKAADKSVSHVSTVADGSSSLPQTERHQDTSDAAANIKTEKQCCCTPKEKATSSIAVSTSGPQHVSVGVGNDESAASHAPPLHSKEATRVHCVPNPVGEGCTCLCDVSVALINVRTTLRRARDGSADPYQTDNKGTEPLGSSAGKRAASTLQLTLSASQAIAAQCACSASCPTCRSDPSTSLSASLLVSTALQIYIRAVRTLRQGLGAGDSSSGGLEHAAISSGQDCVWDVSIGQYQPKANNARRIALFAMKLELRDLRDAIAKISRAACYNFEAGSGKECKQPQRQPRSATALDDFSVDATSHGDTLSLGRTTGSSYSGLEPSGINPIDQVVIRKLHQQLGDLLRTVESIEDQQDAERAATSLSDAY